jgi:stage II sporulation protein D
MLNGRKAHVFRALSFCATGFAVVAGLLAIGTGAAQQSRRAVETATDGDVRIGVMGLFRPQVLRLFADSELEVNTNGRSRKLEDHAEAVTIRLREGRLEVRLAPDMSAVSAMALRVNGGNGRSTMIPARFWLEVPGKLKRLYVGSLEIRAHGGVLEAVISMPLETAVASVVAAESPPGAGLEALKAQAVAARSFLVTRQAGHADFDFCDTTHCQFLRSPPQPGSPADEAAHATRGLILTWHDDALAKDRPLAAMYARSCGGRTRTLAEAGVSGSGYPYYPVRCDYCRRHPEVWQRAAKDAPQTERERLTLNRIHGWGAVPSLPSGAANGEMHGRGVGHGIGLCQLGAADMARRGAGFAQILSHYYPNTRLTSIAAP